MKRNNYLLLLVAVLLVFGLAACKRPASSAPQSVASVAVTEGGFPVPESTEDVMSQLESFATQTAIALSGGTVEAPPPPPATAETGQEPAPAAEATATPVATAAPQVAPTTKPAIVIPTATPGKPTSWTLQRGEHPYCIARRFDVNPIDLLNASGLASGDSYSVGTVLKIPQNARSFPGGRSLKSHPDTFTVSSKDTIYSIACEYGDVDPYDIAAANGLTAPYKLESGQELNIP